MTKKRIWVVIFAMICMFATGCGKDDMIVLTPYGDAIIQNEGSSTGTRTTAASSTDRTSAGNGAVSTGGQETTGAETGSDISGLIHVGFAQVGAESGWRLAQTQSMKETFTAENGYLFDFVDCNNNQKTQLQTLERFVEDGVQYIILDPIVEDGYEDVLKKAQDAGIPVIVVDRNISADASLYACWVGSDFAREGRDAAQWLVSFLSENGRESENLNILTILGSDGASATIGRTDGFEEIANEQSNWNLLDKQTGDFSKDGGYAVMKAYLDKYDDIDVVVCQNDDEAFGAVEAIKEAGRTCGRGGDIIIISFDATGAGFQAMIDGDINVDVECNPLEGPFVAELIQKLEKGETVEEIQYMEEGVFPAEEAADVLPVRAY